MARKENAEKPPTKTTGTAKKNSRRTPRKTSQKTSVLFNTDTTEKGGKLGLNFPIVGIGASAGGLEAFEQFFTNMPSDSGMAFVLVQHLDPTHPSILGELVRRYTRMEVLEIEDGMAITPNRAFIIPPNCDMGIVNGKFQLLKPVAPRGLRLPIDFFFRSMAEDQKERAICIILSGTGTDGTLGLKEIKGAGGMAMVQDPDSSKYDGMPRSAIGTGLVDYTLPPDRMPEQLIAYVKHAMSKEPSKTARPIPKANDLFQKIFRLLRSQTGQDFSHYKQNTIVRRIERRMTVHQIVQLSDYVRYLQENPVEVNTLFKDLLIGVTNFFRDLDAFVTLKAKVIPRLVEKAMLERSLRVWVPGCSTGEEAYSIAILIRDHLDHLKGDLQVQIFGTDIDSDAIETARAGVYPDSIAVDVPGEYLERFFVREENSLHVKKVVRDWIVFSRQNLAFDPPFSRMDLISCRNLLIYMGSELQRRVLPLFHYSLNEDGVLLLGTSETIGEFNNHFKAIDRKWKLYQKTQGSSVQVPHIDLQMPLPADSEFAYPPPVDQMTAKKTSYRQLTEGMLLSQYGPTAVLINEKCEMLYVYGKTGLYLEHRSGEATLNMLSQARQGLRLELATAIRKAITQKSDVRYEHLHLKANGDDRVVNLVVQPVTDPPYMRGLVLVVFEDVTARVKVFSEDLEGESEEQVDSREVSRLQQELSSTKEYLQTTIEELETSNEELKSTNEELQSSNEELQSTNEELETSKEELQSVNEELTTVNTELQNKIDELTRVNNDMNNLIGSTEIGTIFLDLDLNIQRFTPSIKAVANLIPSDVHRPFSDISTHIRNADLLEDLRSVLDTLAVKEREVQVATGDWYLVRVRPYRTAENAVEGIVVTFVEITAQKENESRLRKLQQAVEQSPSVVTITDTEGGIEYVNPKFAEITGYGRDEVLGKKSSILKSGDHSREFYKQLWNTIGSGKEWFGEFHNRKKNGELYWEAARISPLRDDRGTITHFIAVKEDITERKKAEEALKKAHEELERKVAERTADLTEANRNLEREIAQRKKMEETLKQNNELLEKAFSTIHIRIAYLDTRFNFVRVNQAYAEANDMDTQSFVGKHYFDLFPDDSDTRSIFERVAETGDPGFFLGRSGALLNNPVDDARFYDWIVQPISESPKRVSGILLSIIDVTEREIRRGVVGL